jgi:hypothetical protein
MSRKRKICLEEDDYCQQQLLPRGAAAYAEAEMKKIQEFADAHRVLDGVGWADIYLREEAPIELRSLRIEREPFAETVSSFLPPFDVVYTGYGSSREQCKRTAAWGRTLRCVLYADWDNDGVIAHVWAEFFERDESSILAATHVVAALGRLHPLIYADWAWGYTCDASDEDSFASMLRKKLTAIADNRESRRVL